MLALIIGDSGSGKSAFAEKLVSEVRTGGTSPASTEEKLMYEARAGGTSPDMFEKKPTRGVGADLVYLATMEPFGEEGRARIVRHRAQRETLGFTTLECYTDLAGAPVPAGADVLLEDLSNLLANEMFSPTGAAAKAEKEVASGFPGTYGTGLDAAQTQGTAEKAEKGEASGFPGIYGTGSDTAETTETAEYEGNNGKRTDPALNAVRRGIGALEGKSRNLIIVTNEVFSGGNHYEGETLSFLKNLASLNREIALRADLVIEVVCGIPNVVKGKYRIL